MVKLKVNKGSAVSVSHHGFVLDGWSVDETLFKTPLSHCVYGPIDLIEIMSSC